MDAPVIYHFTTLQEWEDAQDKGSYEPPSFQREGFIHCATEEQLEGVLKKHFKQHENLVKLVIDPLRLTASLRYDKDEEQQQEFPHIYGPLNLEAVTQIVFLDPISSED
ncbi:MAG TPA: DUF952 domain-containing protein [Segetibacter sp.]|jgi:uncharacterized protein (DUF952 family)|nr:DUF952 domain-containing protein [Segetibacter sp.]